MEDYEVRIVEHLATIANYIKFLDNSSVELKQIADRTQAISEQLSPNNQTGDSIHNISLALQSLASRRREYLVVTVPADQFTTPRLAHELSSHNDWDMVSCVVHATNFVCVFKRVAQ